MENLGAVRHLGFQGRWISTIAGPSGTSNGPTYQISAKSDSPRLSFINLRNLFLRVGRTDLYEILGRQRAINEFMKLEKDKRHVASFRNHSVSNAKILHFLTPCKN